MAARCALAFLRDERFIQTRKSQFRLTMPGVWQTDPLTVRAVIPDNVLLHFGTASVHYSLRLVVSFFLLKKICCFAGVPCVTFFFLTFLLKMGWFFFCLFVFLFGCLFQRRQRRPRKRDGQRNKDAQVTPRDLEERSLEMYLSCPLPSNFTSIVARPAQSSAWTPASSPASAVASSTTTATATNGPATATTNTPTAATAVTVTASSSSSAHYGKAVNPTSPASLTSPISPHPVTPVTPISPRTIPAGALLEFHSTPLTSTSTPVFTQHQIYSPQQQQQQQQQQHAQQSHQQSTARVSPMADVQFKQEEVPAVRSVPTTPPATIPLSLSAALLTPITPHADMPIKTEPVTTPILMPMKASPSDAHSQFVHIPGPMTPSVVTHPLPTTPSAPTSFSDSATSPFADSRHGGGNRRAYAVPASLIPAPPSPQPIISSPTGLTREQRKDMEVMRLFDQQQNREAKKRKADSSPTPSHHTTSTSSPPKPAKRTHVSTSPQYHQQAHLFNPHAHASGPGSQSGRPKSHSDTRTPEANSNRSANSSQSKIPLVAATAPAPAAENFQYRGKKAWAKAFIEEHHDDANSKSLAPADVTNGATSSSSSSALVHPATTQNDSSAINGVSATNGSNLLAAITPDMTPMLSPETLSPPSPSGPTLLVLPPSTLPSSPAPSK
jgi:hypothetical protein